MFSSLLAPALLVLLVAPKAQAQPTKPSQSPPQGPSTTKPRPLEKNQGEPYLEVEVKAAAVKAEGGAGRAQSLVRRSDIVERLPRSAPDALRYEPGVFVQQSAHAQASPYVRGRTGQQTLLLFDGIRLNNSTFRKGPNQYFFTVDSASVRELRVLRGGASTRFGAGAIGGAIEALPIEAKLDPRARTRLRPRFRIFGASADEQWGFRSQLDAQVNEGLRGIVGFGARRVGQLRSGGQVLSPLSGRPPEVPAFAQDGKTQLGTGFREITADGRLVYRLGTNHELEAASYAYRQFDAPRTDKCPPPLAPLSECLNYDEQFRTLTYATYRGVFQGLLRTLRVTLSHQRQHERRSYRRPAAFVINGGRDDVDTLGVLVKAKLRTLKMASKLPLDIDFGADVYADTIDSAAWTRFLDNGIVVRASRGQYIDASNYQQGGAFVHSTWSLLPSLSMRAGSRVAFGRAAVVADPESSTRPVERSWPAWVGHLGFDFRPLDELSFHLNADRSFRAPNLDDLSARQQTGPGFQIENPELEPERALSIEVGARWTRRHWELQAWFFRSAVNGAIERRTLGPESCPPNLAACFNSQSRLQLVNLGAPSTVQGFELSGRLQPFRALSLRTALSFAYGEGPSPLAQTDAFTGPAMQPLSRIPPLNGNAEIRWRAPRGFYAGLSTRWALAQTRLALSDRFDARIPEGGTPGFVVVDLSAGYRLSQLLLLSLVLENLADSAYRYHGSSVNGAGRGLRFMMETGL